MKMIKQNAKTKTTKTTKMPKSKNNDDSEIFIQKIISLLLLILCEFMQIANNTELLKTLDNPLFFSSIGMKMLFHIFHMNVVYTKNLETIFNNCRSAIYLYFEYLEQMKKTDSLHCLNYLDAIQFVYNKSIYKNHERKQNEPPPIYNISNHIKITNIIYMLLWWENNKLDRNCFSKEIFEKILYYTDYDTFFHKIDEYEEKLQYFQQNTAVNTDEYMKYLYSLLPNSSGGLRPPTELVVGCFAP
jgi:hypothetical protein